MSGKNVSSLVLKLTVFSIGIVVAGVTIYLASIWHEASGVVKLAEQQGFFAPVSTGPESTTEQIITLSEFGDPLDDRVPCPAIANVAHDAFTKDFSNARGASIGHIVTMQIENRFQRRDRSLRGLVSTLFISCQLEQEYDHVALLRVWLNYAYFGNGEFGIETASQSLFEKSSHELNIEQAATLAALLRSPSLYRKNPQALKERTEYILNRLKYKIPTN